MNKHECEKAIEEGYNIKLDEWDGSWNFYETRFIEDLVLAGAFKYCPYCGVKLIPKKQFNCAEHDGCCFKCKKEDPCFKFCEYYEIDDSLVYFRCFLESKKDDKYCTKTGEKCGDFKRRINND